MTEILRVENISVGYFDTRNYYVAEVVIAGEGAKDEGKERFEKLTYYPVLHTAIFRAAERVRATKNTTNLKAWANAVQEIQLNFTKAMEAAANKLAKVAPKLSRD